MEFARAFTLCAEAGSGAALEGPAGLLAKICEEAPLPKAVEIDEDLLYMAQAEQQAAALLSESLT